MFLPIVTQKQDSEFIFWRMLRYSLIPIGLLCLIGCRSDSTRPDTIVVPSRLEGLIEQWCQRSVDSMCIDLNWHRLKQGADISKHVDSLIEYCESGQSSACFYASAYAGRRFLREACSLGETRACHRKASDRLSLEPVTECATNPQIETSPLEAKNLSLYKAQIRQKIGHAAPAFKHCYERKLTGMPETILERFEGKVLIQFHISAHTGEVVRSAPVCSEIQDEEVSRCLAQVAKTLKFSIPEGKERVAMTVNYPFIFSVAP